MESIFVSISECEFNFSLMNTITLPLNAALNI